MMTHDLGGGSLGGVSPTKPTPPISGDDLVKEGAAALPETPFNVKGGGPGAPRGTQPTPMDISKGTGLDPALTKPTVESATKHAQVVQNQLDNLLKNIQTVQQKAGAPLGKIAFNQALKPQVLDHTGRLNENYTVIGGKLALAPAKLEEPSKATATLEHFVNYIAGAQNQMRNVTEALQKKGQNITPADLLAVQSKMNGIQIQIEFFTTIIGKAVDNIKTVLNIQS